MSKLFVFLFFEGGFGPSFFQYAVRIVIIEGIILKYRPIEIKSRLFEKGHSILSIAKQFDCSAANIHQLFKHKAVKSGKPYLIRKYIADAIGEEYQDIWE